MLVSMRYEFFPAFHMRAHPCCVFCLWPFVDILARVSVLFSKFVYIKACSSRGFDSSSCMFIPNCTCKHSQIHTLFQCGVTNMIHVYVHV